MTLILFTDALESPASSPKKMCEGATVFNISNCTFNITISKDENATKDYLQMTMEQLEDILGTPYTSI